MTKDNIEVVKTLVKTSNRPLSDEYISEVSQEIQTIDDLELEQLLTHYMNQYVFFKDMCFDILEEKITMDRLAQILYGFDRGHDA
jgi:hypothetical protein